MRNPIVLKSLFSILLLALTFAAPAQDFEFAQNIAGIWKSSQNGDAPFYFVLKCDREYALGTGYVISVGMEATCAWKVEGDHLHFTQFPPGAAYYEYNTYTSYFDGENWQYSVVQADGSRQDYAAVRVFEPFQEIRNNRLKIGVLAFVNGFESWCLYDKNGKRADRVEQAAYYRLVATARNNMPVVAHGLGLGDIQILGIEGSVYHYIEDHFITGELQFSGYYHFYYPSANRGTMLDWNLIAEGPCSWYHKNGQLQHFGRYKEGVLYGPAYNYDADGNLIKTTQGKPLSEYGYYLEDNVIGHRN